MNKYRIVQKGKTCRVYINDSHKGELFCLRECCERLPLYNGTGLWNKYGHIPELRNQIMAILLSKKD